MAIGVPGCPDFAACTASIASVRMVLMVRRSRLLEDMAHAVRLRYCRPANEKNPTANTTRIESGRAIWARPAPLIMIARAMLTRCSPNDHHEEERQVYREIAKSRSLKPLRSRMEKLGLLERKR